MERPAEAAQDDAPACTSAAAEPSGVVGFLLSDKKRKSLLTQEFVERARCAGSAAAEKVLMTALTHTGLLRADSAACASCPSTRTGRWMSRRDARALACRRRAARVVVPNMCVPATETGRRAPFSQEGHPFDVILHKARANAARVVRRRCSTPV